MGLSARSGLSPLARGNLMTITLDGTNGGTIPARAGEPIRR